VGENSLKWLAEVARSSWTRVARFFLVHNTKTERNVPNEHKWSYNIPNVRKFLQMAVKYFNIFQSKALQNLPKFVSLVWKSTIWQPWAELRQCRQNSNASQRWNILSYKVVCKKWQQYVGIYIARCVNMYTGI
jgi:hypothetical protein